MTKITQAIVLSLLLMGPTWAENAALDFHLFNRTDVNIKKLYVAPSDSQNWEEDLLDGRMLLNGADVEIQFHPSAQAKLWDIRVEDGAGESLHFEDIDLSQTGQVILNADHTATLK